MPPAVGDDLLAQNFALQSAEPRGGIHVGIIMDGNGRWATERGWTRQVGHRAGARAVESVVEEARRAGLAALTLYAFSADNWARPEAEVAALMELFRRSLGRQAARCAAHGIRLEVIGRRDRLPAPLVAAVERAEGRTEGGSRMLLRLAVDYSSRAALAAAATATGAAGADFAERLRLAHNARTRVEAVDLVIRTGGEQRLSDFLLWEAAYAELYFTARLWPDFDGEGLRAALRWFAGRSRRFGALPEARQAAS